ncbi:MAG: nucleotide excision repair endonuclease [Planctomycetota bacterium]
MSTFQRNRRSSPSILVVTLVSLATLSLPGSYTSVSHAASPGDPTGRRPTFPTPSKSTEGVVTAAFSATHDGWSSDEVLLQDDLRTNFVAACHGDAAEITAESADRYCHALIHLRKRGGILAKATRRAPRPEIPPQDAEQIDTVAEIAARRIHDEFLSHTDAILVDTVVRGRFNEIASELLQRYQEQDDKRADQKIETKSTDVLYLVRKSALRLRKTRKLQPELLARVTDWKRSLAEFEVQDLSSRLSEIPEKPGIYIFRDATGFLYIGQAANLRSRLRSHLADSDRVALADYLLRAAESRGSANTISLELHIFESGSPGESLPIRRAYESELIRTRQPRLNIQP